MTFRRRGAPGSLKAVIIEISSKSTPRLPLISKITSSCSIPAFQAGLAGLTPPTVGWPKLTPMRKASMKNIIPKMKFIVTPETKTKARFLGGWRNSARGSSAASVGLSPLKATYPPQGKRETR
ncbi:MAG: hypothetical protein AMS15_01355 [Planctomycetes bacterium DG_23]|nr:MAG: hypothetical protein AMS15_01355 [Planctomycetes bacterium DG_23]